MDLLEGFSYDAAQLLAANILKLTIKNLIFYMFQKEFHLKSKDLKNRYSKWIQLKSHQKIYYLHKLLYVNLSCSNSFQTDHLCMLSNLKHRVPH